ncbi:Transmembrane protein 144 homolog [Seminavis robusta]|uniref:Transmembrane protein 144 homolog n=1 Tax=Seminavis robusta TaxID=568900 RepID=A0A9N8E2I5_9STRA|nr:Transmembrane protein 144 homolog [Seminavis robusta]|eukprot:Sro588_g171500.1 Transmembrane protein 144 homolog (861) ;mRNA; r:19070-22074
MIIPRSRTRTLLAAAVTIAARSAMAASPPDELASQFQKEQGLPGLVVASVAQSPTMGLQMWTAAYGQANIAKNEPMTTDTSLWMASLTKAVVGTAMAKAKEQEYIVDYTDKASTLLSWHNAFEIGDAEKMPWLSDITLEHLATHRSTIRDNMEVYLCGYYVGDKTGNYSLLLDIVGMPNACIDNSPVELGAFLESYLSVDGAYFNATTNFLDGVIPGQQASYSNFGAALAGYLLELATNEPLPDYTHTEMFQVLGMNSTSFRQSDLNTIATPYTKLDGTLEEYMEIPLYDVATFPDGGLRSSVNDMARFLGTIMNGGTLDISPEDDADETATARNGRESTVLLQPESVKEMLRPRYESDRAIFWFVTELEVGGKNRSLIGHNGGDPGAFTYLFFDPDTSTGYFIAGNGDGSTLDPYALADLAAALFAYADELAMDDGNETPAEVDGGAGVETDPDDTNNEISTAEDGGAPGAGSSDVAEGQYQYRRGNVGIGIAGVCVASLFWGSCFTVCKGYDLPKDGVHFAFLMSIGIMLMGILSLLFSSATHGDYQVVFAPLGVFGGFLWSCGNFLTVPIIEYVGLAVGMAIWAAVNMIVCFVVGAMGLPHGILPKEPLSHPSCGVIGVLCALGGLCIFANIKAETNTSTTATDEAPNDEGAAADTEEQPEQAALSEPLLPEESTTTTTTTTTSSSIAGNLPLGVAMAMAAGVFYGFQMVPLTIWNHKVHQNGNIFDDGQPLPSDTLLAMRFFFSQFAGIFVTSLLGFSFYSIVMGQQPQLVPPNATLPSILCGAVWAVGCAGAMLATAELGNAVGFPLVLNCSFLINSAWSILVYKEIQGKRNLQLFGGAFALNFLSSLFISISKA